PCAAGYSRAQGPSGASPARSSAHRTPGATDNTSPRSRRSGGLRPPCSGPARPEHPPAATSRRSLRACIASLPLQSSLMSKTYLKSDHLNGGESKRVLKAAGGDLSISDKVIAVLGTAPQRVGVTEFDSVDKAQAWVKSKEREALAPVREKAVKIVRQYIIEAK